MVETSTNLRRGASQQVRPAGVLPTVDRLAKDLADALSGVLIGDWTIDAEAAEGTNQVIVFGTTISGEKCLAPLTVGTPILLNANASAAHVDHQVDDCGFDHATSCCRTHGTHAPFMHRNCILR